MAEIDPDVRREICPTCDGLGNEPIARAQNSDPICSLCHGRGWVPNVVCEGCGRPAFYKKERVFYCGGKNCFAKLSLKIIQVANVKTGEIMEFPGPKLVKLAVETFSRDAWKRHGMSDEERANLEFGWN